MEGFEEIKGTGVGAISESIEDGFSALLAMIKMAQAGNDIK